LDDVFLKHTGKAFAVGESGGEGGAWWTKWQKNASASQGKDAESTPADSPTANGNGTSSETPSNATWPNQRWTDTERKD
jgi:hypothetical protein